MKKPELLLHIGSLKTGSTSIQRFLHRNRELLLSNGIVFEQYKEFENHHFFYMGLICETLENVLHIKLMEETKKYASSQDVCDSTECFIKAFLYHKAHRLIISCEEFSGIEDIYKVAYQNGKIMSKDEYDACVIYFMNRIKELYCDFDIKIICYLRRQDTFFESLFAQRIKADKPDDYTGENFIRHPYAINIFKNDFTTSKIPEFDMFCCNMGLRANYYDELKRWSDAFGKENVIVRPFERSQLPEGASYDFFSNILKIECDETKYYNHVVVNQRLNRDVLEYKLRFKTDDYYYFEFISISNKMGNLNSNQIYFSPKKRRYFIDYCKDLNSLVAKEYLGRKDGVLFYDKITDKEDLYEGLKQETIFSITRQLIYELQLASDKKMNIIRNDITKHFNITPYSKVNNLIYGLKNKNKKILVYGIVGPAADNIFRLLNFNDSIFVYGVVDKSLKSDYIEINNVNYKVYKFQDIENIQPDIIILTILSSGESVYNQLIKLNLPKTTIYSFHDL